MPFNVKTQSVLSSQIGLDGSEVPGSRREGQSALEGQDVMLELQKTNTEDPLEMVVSVNGTERMRSVLKEIGRPNCTFYFCCGIRGVGVSLKLLPPNHVGVSTLTLTLLTLTLTLTHEFLTWQLIHAIYQYCAIQGKLRLDKAR
jgi:hypothetical protein